MALRTRLRGLIVSARPLVGLVRVRSLRARCGVHGGRCYRCGGCLVRGFAMRERLLGSSGVDWSRVYVCAGVGRVALAAGAFVFHWDDLVPFSSHAIEQGGDRAREAAGLSGVSVAELVRCWSLVQRLQADLGRPLGDVVESVCPVCGGDDVTADDWEFDGPQSWQSVSCDDCGSHWSDVFALVARENVVRGSRVEIATARPETPADVRRALSDWVDMAYEDRNGCGVES